MPLSFWVGFNIFVACMLVLDLVIFHRKTHEIRFREAAAWSAFCIALAIVFNIGVYYYMGRVSALEFLTCYLVEESLSIDNLFIFYLLFKSFHVKSEYQHKILFWGIFGALIMRGIFIALGITLIQRFHWTIYVFGGILIVTGLKMLLQKPDARSAPEANWLLNFIKRILPVSHHQESSDFFVRQEGRLMATPLFVVLLMIEFTDLVFAMDSIPAVLAFSTNPFIVYTSNVFAILGLRALYFVIARAIPKLYYLHYGLGLLIMIVGVKMLASHFVKIPIALALGVTAAILVISTVASLLRAKQDEK
jgi:tellurite resistance protein TerC